MLSRLELQRFRKNCFDAVVRCVKYADLEIHLLAIGGNKLAPYEYFVMKFANQWASKENFLYLRLNQRQINEASVANALHYFQVARTFVGLQNEKNREFIAEQVLEHSKYLTKNNFHQKVDSLADQFENRFKSKNVSAASKLLWLRKRSPVLIFDKWARTALEKMEQRNLDSYEEYAIAWRKNYSLHESEITNAAISLIGVRQYCALWNTTASECEEIVLSEWFLERVFDMYLLFHGKNS
jgi:hypothetical protein